jgi:hypothetical protein
VRGPHPFYRLGPWRTSMTFESFRVTLAQMPRNGSINRVRPSPRLLPVIAMEFIGAVLALGGLFFGLYQFYNAQKWKRAEFAAVHLERLGNDPVLSAACRILDWRSRTIPVPPSLRISDDEFTFEHNWDLLSEGVKPESERNSFDRPMELYRDIFDSFFTYLEQTNNIVDINLVSLNQVASLKYWVQQVAKPRFGPPVEFGPFIDYYGYIGVRQLMRKFEVPEPPAYLASAPPGLLPPAPPREDLGDRSSMLPRPRRRIQLDSDD